MNKWVILLQDWSGHKKGTRIELAVASADQLIQQSIAQEDKGNPVNEAATQIAQAVTQSIKDALPAMIAAEVQRSVTSTAAGGDTATIDSARPGSQAITRTHDNALDDPSGGFKSFAEFAVSVYRADKPGRRQVDERLLISRAASGMSEGDDAGGGYLVPTQHLGGLLKLAWAKAPITSRCRQIPMSSNKIDMPMIRNTDRRTGFRNGGIQVYWLAEAAQKTKSQPKFGKVGLELNEMAGLVFVTNTLLEDSPISLEPLLGEMFAEEFALVMDDAVLRGAGAGLPLGILNAPALLAQPAEANQPPATILAENILGMWSRMWGGSLGTCVWMYNTECLQQLMTMFIPMGVNSLPVFMPPTGLSGSPYGTILGRPAIPMEQCSALGTIGDIMLCDFSYYLIGQKSKTIETTTSIHLRFDYDETAFRYVMRADGQPWLDGPITPMQGSVTKSPFVALATR